MRDVIRERRAEVLDLRAVLAKRLAAAVRHPDEPGSRSAIPHRVIVRAVGGDQVLVDGLAPYGEIDHTGFGIGCVL